MHVWDSESLEITPIESPRFSIMVDEHNGIVILEGYQETGSHCTTLFFFGPESKDNANKWHSWIKENEEQANDVNTKTTEFVRTCFGLY